MNEQSSEPARAGYRPTISDEEAERIRTWHERAYREALAEGSTIQTFDQLGLSVVVPPGVMPVTPMSHLLGEAVLAEAGERDIVLDMGTGSGINGILAASRGARVIAVDINPRALEAAAGERRAEWRGRIGSRSVTAMSSRRSTRRSP